MSQASEKLNVVVNSVFELQIKARPLHARYTPVTRPLHARYTPATRPLHARYMPVTRPSGAAVRLSNWIRIRLTRINR